MLADRINDIDRIGRINDNMYMEDGVTRVLRVVRVGLNALNKGRVLFERLIAPYHSLIVATVYINSCVVGLCDRQV